MHLFPYHIYLLIQLSAYSLFVPLFFHPFRSLSYFSPTYYLYIFFHYFQSVLALSFSLSIFILKLQQSSYHQHHHPNPVTAPAPQIKYINTDTPWPPLIRPHFWLYAPNFPRSCLSPSHRRPAPRPPPYLSAQASLTPSCLASSPAWDASGCCCYCRS